MSVPDFVIEIVDMGDNVICDVCSEDWTHSPVSGGFIFGSYGYCPNCAKEGLERIKKYKEEWNIKGFCPEDMSHADWIRDIVRTGILYQNYHLYGGHSPKERYER